jgi:hypothetical protein
MCLPNSLRTMLVNQQQRKANSNKPSKMLQLAQISSNQPSVVRRMKCVISSLR